MMYLPGTGMMLMYTMCASRIVEAAPQQLVDHVIVLGIDGLGGAKAEQLMSSGVMPNLADIRASSIYSMHCRGDFPTSSATNWHAIMAGASAEMTGVDSNNWLATQPDIADVNGICHNTPTIFSLLRSQRPNATSALVSGWEALLDIAYPKTDITHTVYHEHVEDSADEIIRILSADHPPEFTMLQINELDEAGHGYGYGDEFNKEAARVDVQVGRMVSFVRNRTVLWENTLLLIVADHGREPDGYNHGGLTTLELETMWLALSPVLDTAHEFTPVGRILVTPIRSVDTAPTAAYALGLEIPIQWRGHPVRELFNSTSFGLNYKWPNDRCDAQLSGVVLYTHQPSYVLGLWNGVVLTFSVLGLVVFLMHAISLMGFRRLPYIRIGYHTGRVDTKGEDESFAMRLLSESDDLDAVGENLDNALGEEMDDNEHSTGTVSQSSEGQARTCCSAFRDIRFYTDCLFLVLCILGLAVVIPTMIRVI